MLDGIIVGSFLLLTLFIGLYFRTRAGSFKNFSQVAEHTKQNKWLLIGTIFATSVGGGTVFGLAEKVCSGQIAYPIALLATIPFDIMLAIYIVPKIAKYYTSVTIGDIMDEHYGKVGRALAGIAVVLSGCGYLAAQISVTAKIFRYILEINVLESIVLSYGFMIIYTSFGGLKSILATNFAQFCTMLVAIPMLTVFGLSQVGWINIEQHITSPSNIWLDSFLIACNFALMGCHPTFVQRAFLNKKPLYVRDAILVKSIIYIFFIICITINGLVAHQLLPYMDASIAISKTVNLVMPEGLRGIVVIGLLGAAMSTADGVLNLASLTVAKDIGKPFFGIYSSRSLLITTRISAVIIGTIAIIVSLMFNDVVDIVISVGGIWEPMMIVPFMFAIFNKKISQKGLVLSVIAAFASWFCWEYCFPTSLVRGLVPGTIASFVIFLLHKPARTNREPQY